LQKQGSKRTKVLVLAPAITISTLSLGYAAFGAFVSLLFSSGFLVGFFLWFLVPSSTPYARLKAPYFSALALFFLHRIEEKVFGFFAFLSQVTGIATPDIGSLEVILLVLISVGAWLFIPFLLKRNYEVGYYFAWTFFAAMGITELAHWMVFPWLLEDGFQYIPGMVTVPPLVVAGWIGMCRLHRG
jgi:hypothetical protein